MLNCWNFYNYFYKSEAQHEILMSLKAAVIPRVGCRTHHCLKQWSFHANAYGVKESRETLQLWPGRKPLLFQIEKIKKECVRSWQCEMVSSQCGFCCSRGGLYSSPNVGASKILTHIYTLTHTLTPRKCITAKKKEQLALEKHLPN